MKFEVENAVWFRFVFQCCSKKVDAIEYYEKLYKTYKERVEYEYTHVREKKCGLAFVSLSKVDEAFRFVRWDFVFDLNVVFGLNEIEFGRISVRLAVREIVVRRHQRVKACRFTNGEWISRPIRRISSGKSINSTVFFRNKKWILISGKTFQWVKSAIGFVLSSWIS